MDIEITQPVLPTFVDIEPICENGIAPPLPGQSLNGITGNWDPAIISTSTSGFYTFTPDDNQCSAPVTIYVTINPRIE